ncbi:uncharacterized [Tachysurus ichikawai]
MSSEAHCCVTANLVHASASPTYSTAHTAYKSVLLVSHTFVSGDNHLPRRYWKNPVTRFSDVVFFTATSLKGKTDPPSFSSLFPVLSPFHSHPSAEERPLINGCFYEACSFVLSVVQRSHAALDVPNQPPLICSASSTIPSTSSSMPELIQSACMEL